MGAEDIAISDQKIDDRHQKIEAIPDPRPEDSATTKAELISRKLEIADGDDNQQPPAKKSKGDASGSSNHVDGRRKRIAVVKPESVILLVFK